MDRRHVNVAQVFEKEIMKDIESQTEKKSGMSVDLSAAAVSKQKILIVDDRPENLFSLEKILAATGAETVHAGSGNEALKVTLHHDFALAILDVQMPGMDGYELAEYLRGDKNNRDLPIIFLTAFHSDDQQIFKGYESGGVDYLTKPYNSQILLAKVKIFLQLDRQKKELVEKLELERSRTYLENILSAMSDAVMVVDRQGRIQKVNLAAQRLLEFGDDEIVGESIVDFFAGDEASERLFKQPGRQFSVENQRPFEKKEHTLLNRRKERIPISMSLSLFHNTAGDIVGAVLVAHDIRQLKKEEENRIHLEKMRALGTMTAGMAHELNNPMMGILGFAEYCRKHTDTEDRRHEILGDIERETRRCIDIVQNLLTFSRSGKNTKETLEEICLETIMERVLKLLSYRIEKEGVSIIRNYSEPGMPVNINGESIQQVFLNLVSNALDAMDGRDKKQICIDILSNDLHADVNITDSGAGVTAEDLSCIFDPFYTTKAPGKGTGLGLSTALSIVKAHSGDIECISELEGGTTFHVHLPSFVDKLTP